MHGYWKALKELEEKQPKDLVLELKDKLSKNLNETFLTSSVSNKIENDALNALISLGIPRPNAEKAIKNVIDSKRAIITIRRPDKKSAKKYLAYR